MVAFAGAGHAAIAPGQGETGVEFDGSVAVADYELDWAGAESELEQALKLNPNSTDARYRYVRMLADTGRFDEARARAQARQAIETDPLSIQYRKGAPYILYLSRRYDEAISEYRKLIEIAPRFAGLLRRVRLAQ